MTTATMIQSARFNSTDTASNSEWVTNLKVPSILNQGDSITVSQAYIDSRLNSSGNIVIETDTELSLTYYFYIMFPCDGASLSVTTPADQRSTNTQNLGPALANEEADLAPINYTLLVGNLTLPEMLIYQSSTNPPNYTDNNGKAQAPWKNLTNIDNSPPDIITATINQSFAAEMPMLLVSNTKDINTSVPYTKTWTYTLPAGSYNPSELAQLLTKKMAQIQPQKNQNTFTPYQQFGTQAEVSNLNAFLTKGQQIVVSPPILDLLNIAPFADLVPQTLGLTYSSNTPGVQPALNCVAANFLTDATYNPKYFTPETQSGLSFNSPLVISPTKYVSQYTKCIAYNPIGDKITNKFVTNYASPIIGASEVSLEYNEGTSLFQFTYLHTPLLQLPTTDPTATEPVEVVKIIKTVNVELTAGVMNQEAIGQVNICEQTRHSGVFFQSMQPISFWRDILGFDVANITFAPEYIWGENRQMTFTEFNKVTTSGYVGIENNFNFSIAPANATEINTNQPVYLDPFPTDPGIQGELTYSNLLNSARWFSEQYMLSNPTVFKNPGEPFNFEIYFKYFYEEYSSALIATNALQAIQSPLSQVSSTGHYLINIDGYQNTKNDFINDDDIYNIKSIVSNYYLSQGAFATQPFSSTAIYVHNSPVPKVIDSFRIRLIDPINMKNASNIGPNSSVYLQINKIVSDLSITQPG